MLRKIDKTLVWKIGLAVVFAAAAIGLTATIINAQGPIITACVNNENGNVRIVSSANDCKRPEHQVQWPSAGAQGAQGPAGPQGPAGFSGYQIVEIDVSVPPGGFLRNAVACPAGKVVLGGGASVVGAESGNFHTILQESSPGTANNGGGQSSWLVAVQNNDGVPRTIGIFAICANATQ